MNLYLTLRRKLADLERTVRTFVPATVNTTRLLRIIDEAKVEVGSLELEARQRETKP